MYEDDRILIERFLAATEGHVTRGLFRVMSEAQPTREHAVYEDALDDAERRSRGDEKFARIEEFDAARGAWRHNTAWLHGWCVEDCAEVVLGHAWASLPATAAA